MTVVNVATGEIIEPLDEAAARRLTERIRLGCESISERIESTVDLIEQARQGRADVALGYASWTAYVEAEFADALPRLDRSQRQDVVRRLSDKGMSTRAIAPVVGADNATVHRDLARVASATPQPEPDDAPGWDGPDDFEDTAEIIDAEIVEDPEPEPAPKITGRDGKAYSRPPAPRAAPRSAITDDFRDATTALLKTVNKITDLAADERFTRNKEQLATRNGSELQRAIDALTGVLDRLN